MNCPTCKQSVGIEQHRYGPWRYERDAAGEVVDASRVLYVNCDFCGSQEVVFGHRGEMRSRRGPFKAARDIRRVLSQTPEFLGRAVPA